MDIWSERERLFLIDFVRVHWGLKAWNTLRILRHLRVVNLTTFLLRLRRLGLFLTYGVLLSQIQLLRHYRPAVHPVECNKQRRIDLGHLGGLN